MDRSRPTPDEIAAAVVADTRGMTPEEIQHKILFEVRETREDVREINGTVRTHERLWFGDEKDPGDTGNLPDIRANTTFRQQFQIGARIMKYVIPTGTVALLIDVGLRITGTGG